MKEIIIKLDLMDIFSEVEEFGEDNVEVESVGKTLKEKIKTEAMAKLSEYVLKSYKEQLKNDLEPTYNEILENTKNELKEISKDFINKKVVVTDRWGDIVESNISIKDLIIQRLDKTFDIKNEDSEFMKEIDKIYKYELKKKIEDVIYEIKKELTKKIETETAEKVRAALFK
ncbi:hypothetical protein [Fusobacterium polymorphum]|jgi:hypothetical protein|uniref:hypothetical protein n=1 Tax=Fusobacterium nucleatum subsp. polymorphum TaxID=76857 RepID=UPI00300B1451